MRFSPEGTTGVSFRVAACRPFRTENDGLMPFQGLARGYHLASIRDLNAPKLQTAMSRFHSLVFSSKILHGVGLRP